MSTPACTRHSSLEPRRPPDRHIHACLRRRRCRTLRQHRLPQVVVAEDLFKLCDPEMGPAIIAMKKAVLQWAGQEQAGSVQLLSFLEGNVSRWRELLRDAGEDATGCRRRPAFVGSALERSSWI